MRKYLIILTMLIFTAVQPVIAKNIKVQALDNFSTAKPTSTWSVKLVDDITTKDGTTLYAGSVIYGNIVGITDPKRLKRNASINNSPVFRGNLMNA